MIVTDPAGNWGAGLELGKDGKNPENQIRGKKNWLKGHAAAKIILQVIKETRKEDLSCFGSETRYENIRAHILDNLKKNPVYVIRKTFMIDKKTFISKRKIKDFKDMVFFRPQEEINTHSILFINEKYPIEIETKKWVWVNTPHPQWKTPFSRCASCGYELIGQTHKKICPKCGSKSLNKVRHQENIIKTKQKLEEKWNEKANGTEILKYLLENKLITTYIGGETTDQQMRYEFDTWYITKDEKELFIFESKNKENTRVTFGDLFQCLRYLDAAEGEPLFRELSRIFLLYNGILGKELAKMLDYLKNEKTPIFIHDILKWAAESQIFYNRGIINDLCCGMPLLKNSDYCVNWIKSDVEKYDVILYCELNGRT